MIYSAYATTDDAVVYSSMDVSGGLYQTSTVIDISTSMYQLNGTNNSAVVTTGKINQGFDFTPNQYINMMNNAAGLFNSSSDQRTYLFWMNEDDRNPDKTILEDNSNNGYIIIGWGTLTGTPNQLECSALDGGWNTAKNTTPIGAGWKMVACRFNNTHIGLFIDNVLHNAVGITYPLTGNAGAVILGSNAANNKGYDGKLDEIAVYNRSLTLAEMTALYNAGNGLNPYAAPPSPETINLSVLYPLNRTNSSKTLININLSGNFSHDFNATLYINGTINETKFYYNGSNVFIDFTKRFPGGNFYSFKIGIKDNQSQVNSSENIIHINFSNPIISYEGIYEYNATNHYVRTLYYDINITFCPSNSSIIRYINGIPGNETDLECTGSLAQLSGNYTHYQEGEFNISFFVNSTRGDDIFLGYFANKTLISDLYNPTITYLNISVQNGFYNGEHLANVSLRCGDNIAPIILYNSTLNGVSLFMGNRTNGTLIVNRTNIVSGSNSLQGYCKDFFGANVSNITKDIYARSIYIINERTNNLFDYTNLTSLIVYFDDNSTSFNFKTNATSHINFTSELTSKLRFELVYSNGDVITRYIDTSLSTEDLRVCANTDPSTYYEQIIIASTQRKVSLKNVFSNCVIAEDYTRFAYQDSLILKAYSINSLYYLYTFDGNKKVYLASMDGSLSTYYNIDVLEFKSQSVNIAITPETLTFDRESGYLRLYYKNSRNDSISTAITITQLNNSQLLFSSTETDSPNEFYMYFDYTTLNVTNGTLFKIDLTKTDSEGVVTSMTRYFNTLAQSGIISSGFAFTIALLLLFFGLTLTIVRLALGYFGVVICLMSLAVLSLGVGAWYITLLMAIDIIIAVFIALLLWTQNYQEVA